MKNEDQLIEAVKGFKLTKDRDLLKYITDFITGFIINKAFKLAKNSDIKNDLIQEGYVGLLDAVNRCNIDNTKTNISTYLCTCAYGKMLDYIRNTSDVLDLARRGGHFPKIYILIRKLGDLDLTHKDVQSICEEHNIPIDKFILVLNVMRICDIDNDYAETFVKENTEDRAIIDQTLDTVNSYLKTLSVFKQDAFVGRFSGEYTTRELSKKYGVGSRWVRITGDEVRKELQEMLCI